MTENDNKLLEIVSALESNNPSQDEEIETEVIEAETTTIDDIEDVISKNFDRVLAEKDYLILVALDTKGIETVALDFKVSVNYIKKLMRSTAGAEFIKQQAKQKSEMALAVASSTVAEGVLKYQQMVQELFAKGDTSLALSFLFGKQSLSEVQQTLNKQLSEQPEETGDELKSLFSSLLVDKKDG